VSVPKVLKALLELDLALEREGVPALSAFWRKEARRMYRSSARLHVACVGRGGMKTGASIRFDVAETLAGDFDVRRGERHYHTRVSENVDEAAKSLSLLEQYLKILGVAFKRSGDTIELKDQPRGFKVLACRVGAVSGWRSIGWTADECAKWSNEGADPSAEVIASLNAMTVTHTNARRRMYSSPLATSGYFYDAWARGDSRAQLTAHAPTWVANPSVSEAQTLELEPDPRVWAREYAAIPQAGALGAFDPDAIDAAMGRHVEVADEGAPVLIVDPSSGRKDAWTWAVARWVETPSGGEVLRFDLVDGLEGRFWKQISGDAIVDRLAALARQYGARAVHADQRESLMLKAAFTKRGLRYFVHDWTNPSKVEAVERVRRWLADGALALPRHEKMRRELLAFTEKITPSGAFTFGPRGTGHDDFVALLITAAMADIDRKIKRPRQAEVAAGSYSGVGGSTSIDHVTFGGGAPAPSAWDQICTLFPNTYQAPRLTR
jgi:hypothetical protein